MVTVSNNFAFLGHLSQFSQNLACFIGINLLISICVGCFELYFCHLKMPSTLLIFRFAI
ncbi:hypothetical protein JHK82_014514 [Glycine max]|uniref:Uncharacterized protein n=1 Tax=Glycine soja TaxID=3848 RepID=A0A445K5F8_GLYSO|nr:hypothetical protein JHK87_014425 [Glycine soja]KAG5147633.1 hypothetical protein JHK82_014514 [Glycine max]KAH1124419.1 hypothetical protein GYH30_014239 [Glycine max]RZC06059.1 hypothetical protein D0Y65_013896 [Glycine soja]